MKKALSCLLAILCLRASAAAQSHGIGIRPLTIGDAVPSFVLHPIVHYKTPSAAFADFKDKLLIIDLMSTNCYSCISHLHHFDSLQIVYKDRLQILPVSSEPVAKVQYLLEKTSYGKRVHFPFAAEDTLLSQLFPHQFISHMVWIYKGKVKAITRADYVTTQNIDIILADKPIHLPVKKDLGHYDPAYPLLVPNPESLLPSNQAGLRYYSTVFPFLKGYSYGKYSYVDTVQNVLRFTYLNAFIPALYQYALGVGDRFPHVYVHIDVKDSSRFFFNSQGYRSEWQEKAYASYQAATPVGLSDSILRVRMLADLNFHLGLQARLEKKSIRCWVLRRDTAIHDLPPRPQGEITSIGGIASLQSDRYGATPIFVDMEGDSKRYVPIPPNLDDKAAITALLQPYGIRITEEYRELQILTISDALGYHP